MRKLLILWCGLWVLLCGCSASGEPSGDTPPCDHMVQLAYYEQRAEALERELLTLKTEIYVNRVEYEEKLTRLEGELEMLRDAPSGGTAVSTPESDFRYTVGNGVATVTEYVGNGREVCIPAALGGYPVRVIGDRAFADCTSLVAVEIPRGVEQIGWFSFAGCVMLERVTLPESLLSISYGAFQNCKQTLTVVCVSGSYAEQYARSYGFAVENG